MRALVAVLLIVGIGAGVAAYHGMFYVTGSQFHEACSQRQAKEKIDGGFKEVGADNLSQAALWSSCTPIMGQSMANAGFAIGSSSPQATEDAKALVSACPNAYTEMPVFPKFWYTVAVDAIEKNGGPSLIGSGSTCRVVDRTGHEGTLAPLYRGCPPLYCKGSERRHPVTRASPRSHFLPRRHQPRRSPVPIPRLRLGRASRFR